MAKKPSEGDAQSPAQALDRPTRKRAQATTTGRIGIRSTEGADLGPDAIQEAWRAAGVGAEGRLAETARRIMAEGVGGNAAFRGLADQAAALLKEPLSEAAKAMSDGWQAQSAQLRRIQTEALNVRPLLANIPSAEVTASRAIEAQTARLVEISIRTSEQIAQLAQLTEAALEQQVQGVLTAAQMREDAKRSARTLNWLTLAIFLLTAALVADALKLGPFA